MRETTVSLQLLIFPGFHQPLLTQQFVAALRQRVDPSLTIAAPVWPDRQALLPPVAIAFSAGTVAAAAWLWRWQQIGNPVAGLIALDGWGVPLGGNFPIFRLSHDLFTHRTSLPLGSGPVNFYADPATDHLALWQRPAAVSGWQVSQTDGYRVQATTALDFIEQALGAIAQQANSRQVSE